MEQDRQRVDDLLYKWKLNSQSMDLVSCYNLLHQHWLIKDVYLRQNMINGTGPMRMVKNHMNYSIFRGKRSVKKPDEYDHYRNALVKGDTTDEDGIIAFATANDVV